MLAYQAVLFFRALDLFSIRRSDWKEMKIVYGSIIIGINIISTSGRKGVGACFGYFHGWILFHLAGVETGR